MKYQLPVRVRLVINDWIEEMRPRFGESHHWPMAFQMQGLSRSLGKLVPERGAVSGAKRDVIEGEYENVDGTRMKFVGAGKSN
ncbi:MAG TPA: hypothetical protein VFY67_04405 [Pyrinomonadaceae bacterium]|nr:hypothetical protein [Pyrinomonadaceae bacterium]